MTDIAPAPGTEEDDQAAEAPPFWWGVSSSALQTEGVAPAADWSRWERDKRVPHSGDGNGTLTNHRDDMARLAELGVSHVRLTLEWARIEPEKDRTDSDAVDRYLDLLASAKQLGLSVVATLHHGSLPGWFADDEGGYRDERARDYLWTRQVDRVAETFGHMVDCWVPIDDPIGWAIRGFLVGNRPPGVRDLERATEFIEGALLANQRAEQVLRAGDAPVMAVFGVPTLFRHGPESEEKWRWWHEVLFESWIGLLRDGELVLPNMAPRRYEEMTDTFDLIGITHDNPMGIDHFGAIHPYPADGRRSDTGFTPIANELAEVISYLSGQLPQRELVVAGHGISTSDDEWREELLRDTLPLLDGLIGDGVNLRGYFHDTGIDGYELRFGFATQRGLLNRSREFKDSAHFFSEAIAARRA